MNDDHHDQQYNQLDITLLNYHKLFDDQQLESQQKERTNDVVADKNINLIKKTLFTILNKDLSSVEKEIQRIKKIIQFDSEQARNQKLLDQLQLLKKNKEQFQYNREKIVKKITAKKDIQEEKLVIMNSLRKMKLAQKFLQNGLPIIKNRLKILQKLREDNIMIIQSTTGSGKSSQLPQILCDYYKIIDDHNQKPILVTQQTRLATRSLAQRVSHQIGEMVGGFIDYANSKEKQTNTSSKIIFKLDKILLIQLAQDSLLSKYSSLIINIGHKRTCTIDLILGMVKNILQKRKDFKVIVALTQHDNQIFQNYFNTSIFRIGGEMPSFIIQYRDQGLKSNGKDQNIDKIKKLINQEILQKDPFQMKQKFKGNLLCFCSNRYQIQQLVLFYKKMLNKNKFIILQLHQNTPPQEQMRIIQQNQKIKLIFASSIAEAAITIDGLTVIIDLGEQLKIVYDQNIKMSLIKPQHITQSAANQRARKLGRNKQGYCFRLYSQKEFNKMQRYQFSQIKKQSIESLILKMKQLNINDVVNFPYIQGVQQDKLIKSQDILKLNEALNPLNGKITKIGLLMNKISLEPALSRPIIEGIMMQNILHKNKHLSQFYKKISPQQFSSITSKGIRKSIIYILVLIMNYSKLYKDQNKRRRHKYRQKQIDQQNKCFFLQNLFREFKILSYSQDQDYSFCMKQNTQLFDWIQNNNLDYEELIRLNFMIKNIQIKSNRIIIEDEEYEEEFKSIKNKILKYSSYNDMILSCLMTTFNHNISKYSGNPNSGYTMVFHRECLKINTTKIPSQQKQLSSWIICFYYIIDRQGNRQYKIVQKVTYQFMKIHLPIYALDKLQIQILQKCNLFYKKSSYTLPTLLFQSLQQKVKQRNNNKLIFFEQSFPEFIKQANTVNFNLGIYNETIKRKSQIYQKQIKQYIFQLQKNVKVQFIYKVSDQLSIDFDDSFQINQLRLNYLIYNVYVVASEQICQLIKQKFKRLGIYFDIESFSQSSLDQNYKEQALYLFDGYYQNLKICVIQVHQYYKLKIIQNKIQQFQLIYSHIELQKKFQNCRQMNKYLKANKNIQKQQQKKYNEMDYYQIMTVANQKSFMALQQQYITLIDEYNNYYSSSLTLNNIQIQCNFMKKYIIYAESDKKENFIQPQIKLKDLFIAKIMKLNNQQLCFLDKFQKGSQILQKIEYEKGYSIYFGFNLRQKSLKIYVYIQNIKQIEKKMYEMLQENLKNYNYLYMSIQGKKLKQIQKQIQKINKDPKNFMHIIDFDTHILFIFGRKSIIQNLQNIIQNIPISHNRQCLICNDSIVDQYILLNCQCQYCQQCIKLYLIHYAKSFKLENPLCPSSKCNKLISINDIRKIFQPQCFYFLQIIQTKLFNFIKINKNKYKLCPFCQQIIDIEDLIKGESMKCFRCGCQYCLQCDQPHKFYNCDQWRHLKQQHLPKRCPQCMKQIYKKDQCNYIYCQLCIKSICSICMETFITAKQCFDHLLYSHGAIFDEKNEANYSIKQNNDKRCPFCLSVIQRNEGCNYLQCQQCKSHICWPCLKIYNNSKQCYDHILKQHKRLFDDLI